MAVSAVIPHRNSRDLLGRCLDALGAAGIDDVVVADEESTDGSIDRAQGRQGVQVVQSPGRGFAAAMNEGVRVAGGDLLLLMNSDAFVRADTVQRLRRRLEENPALALCGAALVDEDGARTKTHHFRLTLRRALIDALGIRPELPQEGTGIQFVEAVFPNCALARRSAIEEVGGFDERFPFYYEDMDLCWRLREAGWKLAVDWDAEAVHLGGGSTSSNGPQRWFRQYHAGRVIYLRKHYPRAWILYAMLWAPNALARSLSWHVRAALRRLRSDAAGAVLAQEWAEAFRHTARLRRIS